MYLTEEAIRATLAVLGAVGATGLGLVLVALAGATTLVAEVAAVTLLQRGTDHGTLARRVDADIDDARSAWQSLADVGVDMDDVAVLLEREGVASFAASFDELIAALDAKAATLG